jgi:hypothetical protein
VNDLTEYPINGTITWVRPRYNLIDSVWDALPADTQWIATADLVQDSVNVYFVSPAGDNSIWIDRFAYRNNRYAIGPPTIGVATFDGLDDVGYPYDFVNTSLTGKCDYLTSKPLRLGTKPSSLPYTAADSVYLSFFYQSTGRGNAPEVGDSLVLQFWSPDSNKWYNVWSTPGVALADFKQVMIPITANKYFGDGFQFRFYNRGNLSGSLDHWHIDYVYLNSVRSQGDTIRQDPAFMYDALSLLKKYTAMPWNHFLWDPAGNMADTMSVYQRNNDNVSRIITNQNMEIFYNSVSQGTITAPLNPGVTALTNFSSLYDIQSDGFVYDTSLADTCAVFDINVHFNPGANFTQNDTISFQQIFRDYYAYDDGTAEAAYGPQGTGAKLAYRFSIAQPDSLRAVRMHFEPSVNNASNNPFLLTVWDATGAGATPGNIIYQNIGSYTPEYIDQYNGFSFYAFESPVYLSGTFYIGWQQLDLDRLNIGFDMNTNQQSNIYYNASGSWQNTSFQGALMMRPVFGRCSDDVTSVAEIRHDIEFELFPNPANNAVNIRTALNYANLVVMDLSGRVLNDMMFFQNAVIDLNQLANGIYLISVTDEYGNSGVKKLIVQH